MVVKIQYTDADHIVVCDRCKEAMSEVFNKPKTIHIASLAFIHICDKCKNIMGSNALAALKVRTKTGVVFAELSNGVDGRTLLHKHEEFLEWLKKNKTKTV